MNNYPATRLLAGAVLLVALAVVLPDRAAAAKPGGGCNLGVLNAAKATFRDDPADGVRSDGRGTYTHCQDGQVSIGKQEGRFRIDTGKYNPNNAKMHITLDVADCLTPPPGQSSCSGVPLDRTTDVTFQTHTRYDCPDAPGDLSTCDATGEILDLRTMPAGQVRYTRLFVAFFENPNKGHSGLAFMNASEGVVGPSSCEGGNPVKVTCDSVASGSCNKWTMEGDKACYTTEKPSPGPVFKGLFSVPVQFTVELVP